jgi:hypothetical protein
MHIGTKWHFTSETGWQLSNGQVKETSADPVLLGYDTMLMGN